MFSTRSKTHHITATDTHTKELTALLPNPGRSSTTKYFAFGKSTRFTYNHTPLQATHQTNKQRSVPARGRLLQQAISNTHSVSPSGIQSHGFTSLSSSPLASKLRTVADFPLPYRSNDNTQLHHIHRYRSTKPQRAQPCLLPQSVHSLTYLGAMDTDDEKRVGEALQERDRTLLDLNLARRVVHTQQATREHDVAVHGELCVRGFARDAEALAATDAADAHDAPTRGSHAAAGCCVQSELSWRINRMWTLRMEVLLLDNEAYVLERYHEIQAEEKKRRDANAPQRQHQQPNIRHDADNSRLRQLWMATSSSESDEELVARWQTQQQRQYGHRACDLDARWPKSHLERKLVVLQTTLEELYSAERLASKKERATRRAASKADTTTGGAASVASESSERSQAETTKLQHADDMSPFPFQDLPLATQLGLRIFSRFCRSLQEPGKLAANSRMLLQVATKLPSLLAALPPFPLSPGFAAASESPTQSLYASNGSPRVLSVFQTLFELLSDLLNLPSSSSSAASTNAGGGGIAASERSVVRTAYIALCLKWGSLRHLLSVIYLLLDDSQQVTSAQFEHLEPLFTEVARAMPEVYPSAQSVEESCSGYLMSFGKGDHGKLGHGQCSHGTCAEGNCTENKCSPTMITATRDARFIKIDSLSTHSVAITTKGEAMTWGNGDKYRLGHGTTTKEYTPRIIESINVQGRVIDISCGLGHTIALMESGDLYVWGNGSNGRLGLGDTNDRASPTKMSTSELNCAGQSAGNDDQSKRSGSYAFRHVYCGASHSLAVGYDGRAYSWGKNNQGQCGHGHTNDQLSIQEVQFFRDEVEEDIVHAAGGWEHTLFCSASGRVFSAGCGYKDSRRTGIPPVLGHGDCERRLKPTVIQSFIDANEVVSKVACGWDHSLAVTMNGLVYSWGSGTNGKLGHGDEENCDVPALIRSMENKQVKEAKAGCEHTVLLTEDREVWTFGQGDSGRLGHGDNQTRKVPTLIESFAQSGLKPVAIAVGDKYNLVLAEECHSESDSNGHSANPKHSPSSDVDGFAFRHKRRSSFLRRELQKKKNLDTNPYLAQHRYESDWVLAVGESLQKYPREDQKQPEFDKSQRSNSTEETLSHDPLASNSSVDHFTPASRDECTLFLLGHIDRLSSTYFCEGRDKCQRIGENDADTNCRQVGSNGLLLPFAIDTSRETFVLLLQILRLQCPASTAEANTCSSTDGSRFVLLHRMCIVLSCLRILKVNLSKCLQAGGFAAVSGALKDRSARIERTCSSSDLETVNTIDQIHYHIDRFASADASGILEIFVSKLGEREANALPSQNELVNIATAVSREAAQVLQADVMEELFLHIFAVDGSTMEMKHSCKDCLGQTRRENVQMSSSLGVREGGGGKDWSAADLVNLMIVLLQRCSVHAVNRLEAVDQANPNESSLRMLTVLQVHFFGIATMFLKKQTRSDKWNDVGDQHSGYGNVDICVCAISSLLLYLDALFSESMLVLKKLHKASCQHEEVITWRLNRTFFDNLLPNAIEVLCVLLPLVDASKGDGEHKNNESICFETIQLRFVHRLLPHLHPMLKMLDEVNWKMRKCTDGNNQARHELDDNHEQELSFSDQDKWVMELQDACAILCGKLACALTSPSALNPATKRDDLDVFRSRMLSAEFMLPSDCKEKYTVTAEMVDMLQWEKMGVFEVENELVQSGDATSDTPNAHKVDLVQLTDNQEYLLGYIDSSSSCIDVAKWLAAQLSESPPIPSIPESHATHLEIRIRATVAVVFWNCNLAADFRDCQKRFCSHRDGDKSVDASTRDECLERARLSSILSIIIKVIASTEKETNSATLTEGASSDIVQKAKFLLRLQPNSAPFSPIAAHAQDAKQAGSKSSLDFAANLYRFLKEPISLLELENVVVAHTIDSALSRIGLCFYHDLLRKLTISSTKTFLLGELISAMQCPSAMDSMDAQTRQRQLSSHTAETGSSGARSLCKSIENLYIRLAKLISADESSASLKKKALLAWTVRLEEFGMTANAAADVVAKAGVVNTIHGLLLEDVLESQAALNRSHPVESTQHGSEQEEACLHLEWLASPMESSSPGMRVLQKFKPVASLLYGQTSSQSLSLVAWVAFCAVSLQLSKSDSLSQQPAPPLLSAASLSTSTRALSGKDLIGARPAISPRKRLTLPKRTVVSTVAESVDQVYELLFASLTKTKHAFDLLTSNAQKLVALLSKPDPSSSTNRGKAAGTTNELRQALLFGNPVQVSSSGKKVINSVMPPASFKRPNTGEDAAFSPQSGSAVSAWVQIDQTGVMKLQQHQNQPDAGNSFASETPILFALGSDQQTPSTPETEPEASSGAASILADSGLALFAYSLEEKQVALAVAFKVHEGECQPTSTDSSSSRQLGADQLPAWEVLHLHDDILVGQWVHFAIVFHKEGNAPVVYIDGKTARTRSHLSTHVVEATSLWKLGPRVKISVGGTLSGEEHTALVLGGNKRDDKPRGSKKHRLTGVLDDLWLFDMPLSDQDISWIYQQGPVLLQLKRQHLVESHCADVLKLLCQLSHSFRLRSEKQPSTAEKSAAFSARWVSLFVQLLEVFPSEGQIQILLCELLQHTLPRIEPQQEIQIATLARSVFRKFDSVDTHEGKRGESKNSRYLFLKHHGVMESPHNHSGLLDSALLKRNECLQALMGITGALFGSSIADCAATMVRGGSNDKTDLSSNYHGGGSHGDADHVRPSSLSLSALRFEAGVQLFQQLCRAPAWQREVQVLLSKAASGFQAVRTQETGGWELNSNPSYSEIAGACVILGGYSELAVNQRKASLIRLSSLSVSPLSKMRSPFSSAMKLSEASVVSSDMPSQIFKLVCAGISSALQLPACDTLAKKYCEGGASVEEVHAFDRNVMTLVHLKASLLRFLMLTLRDKSEVHWRNLIFDNQEVLERIFQMASVPCLELISSVLGPDSKKALRLRSVRAVVQEFTNRNGKAVTGNPCFSLPQLEALVWGIWDASSEQQTPKEQQSCWWQEKLPYSHSPLEVLGGEVELRHTTVKALEHFPTIRLSNAAISVNTGLWFYEVLLLSDGLMQIGYIDADFVSDPIQGQGVGDHTNSWGFDGFRCKKWNVNSSDYGEVWRVDDVVGVLLDTDRMELSFFLNGNFLGVAFSGLPMTSSSRMCPAASLNVNQMAQFNFGTFPKSASEQECSEQLLSFAHVPVLDSEQDQSRLQPVALAISQGSDEKNGCSDLISEAADGINDLDDESEGDDDCGASSDDDGEGDAETPGMNVMTSSLLVGDARDTMGSRETSERAIESGALDDSTIVERRNDLIDGVTGLGFPREWAMRCATETNLSVNESGAVSWILEQMEKDAAAGVDVQDTSSTGSTGAHSLLGSMLRAPDLSTSRSADDLSLLSSSAASGNYMLTLPSTHHPSQGFRPHTEHLSRNRLELFSELQPSKQHSVSTFGTRLNLNAKRRSLNEETNPFLIAEQEDMNLDEGASTDCFAAQEYYTGRGLEVLADNLLHKKSMLSHPYSSCQNVSERATDDEAVPLCLTLDTMLSLMYARQSLFYLITSEDQLPKVFHLVSRWSANGDAFRRLTRFLRATIGLEKQELRVGAEYLAGITGISERSLRLQKTMQALLKMETERCSAFGEGDACEENNASARLPIFHALFGEIRDQCTQAGGLLHRSERREKKDPSAVVHSTAQNALWVLWLAGILFTEVESQVSLSLDPACNDDTKACERLGSIVSKTCYSLPFFQSLVAVASGSACTAVPWKLAAFTMMKRILFGISRVRRHHTIESELIGNPDPDKSGPPRLSAWISDPPSHFQDAARIQDILDLFALRYHKEKSSHVFLSSLTRLLFAVLVRFSDSVVDQWSLLPSSSPISDADGDATELGNWALDFFVEAFSSNHATVSWNQQNVQLDADMQHQGSTPTAVAENTLLSLSVVRERDPFHGDDANGDEHLPRVLPSKGSYTIRNLAPDTRYILRLAPMQTMASMESSQDDVDSSSSHPQGAKVSPVVAPERGMRELHFQTPPEPRFDLDADSMGKNLVLSNRNLSVKNLVNKKWHTVRASVGFDEGIHQWHVRIDACVSKNIFIGVCTSQASLENYIGSDRFGYGFLANKAVWHNKSKLHSYGEIFKQGDLLQVTLDCTAKTLAFSRNGEYLGIAATNLHVANSYSSASSLNESSTCKWYPAFSMYNKDDQLTIIPPSSATMFAKSERQQHASMLDTIEAMRSVDAYRLLASQPAQTKQMARECYGLQLYRKAFSEFEKWRLGKMVFREVELGQFICIDSSESRTRKFGISTGDSIFTSKGQATVLGECNHELWYEGGYGSAHAVKGGDTGLDSWNLHTCRQMLASPNEFPVHRHPKHSAYVTQAASDNLELEIHQAHASSSEDSSAESLRATGEEVSLEAFQASQQLWSRRPSMLAIDEKLVELLEQVACSRAIADPQHLSFLDITAAFVTDNLMAPLSSLICTLNPSLPSTMTSSSQIMTRIGLLLHVNRSLYRVVRLVLSEPMRSTLLPASLQHAKPSQGKRGGEKQDGEQEDTAAQVEAKKQTAFIHAMGVTEAIASLTNSPQWSHPDPSDVCGAALDRLAARLLFGAQKEKLVQEALRNTATSMPSSSVKDTVQNQPSEFTNHHLDDSYDPSELPRIRVRLPDGPTCVPFWNARAFSCNHHRRPSPFLIPSESFSDSVFIQVSKQLQMLPAQEWRRAYSTPFEPMPITRTFHAIVESTDSCAASAKPKHTVKARGALDLEDELSSSDGAALQENDDQQQQPPGLTQAAQYLQLLERVMIELQSPAFPLFAPVAYASRAKHDEGGQVSSVLWDADDISDGDGEGDMENLDALTVHTRIELDLNLSLFSPSVAPHCQLSSEKVLLWYFQFGQLLGIAWRGGILLPLQCITKSFWSALVVGPSISDGGENARRDESIRPTVLHAIRDGLFSIIPSRCMSLLTPKDLRQRLSDPNVFAIRSLKHHAVYTEDSTHHKMFWDLISEFTALERRALLLFLTGTNKPRALDQASHENEANESAPFVVEISEAPLTDSQSHPDACYPVVVHVGDHSSRVHLPAYSSAAVMRKKLTQAMMNFTDLQHHQ